MDNVSNAERKKIVLRAEALRESIKQHFRDIEHWNDSVRRSDEEPIDPDPDGKLSKMLKSLDDGLRRERVKKALRIKLNRKRSADGFKCLVMVR